MVNAHARNKEYYGGETMPEGMRDCNSCGWYGKEEYFRYGLCSCCGECEWWQSDEEQDDER